MSTEDAYLWPERDRRQMGRDLLRLDSMVAGGRVQHRYPVDALAGLRGLLSTAAKRHRRYWGRRSLLDRADAELKAALERLGSDPSTSGQPEHAEPETAEPSPNPNQCGPA